VGCGFVRIFGSAEVKLNFRGKVNSACYVIISEMCYVNEELENNLFFLCALHHSVWYNFLGKLTLQ